MPILSFQLNAESKAADGSITQLSPQAALMLRGPITQVTIGLIQNMAEQLLQDGKTPPTPESGYGLIDTGATGTCVDIALAQKMGLPVIDKAKMHSASHADQEMDVFPITVMLPGNLAINVPRAMGANLGGQGLVLLIGRDVLQHCVLICNGITGSVTLGL